MESFWERCNSSSSTPGPGKPDDGQARLVTQTQITLLVEEIDYWKNHVAQMRGQLRGQSGAQLWTREDFHKGDFAQSGRRFYEVMRVNHKTLTVVTGANTADLEIVTQANARNALGGPGRTGKLPYHSIKGRLTAEQARELFPDAFPPARPGPGEAAGSESDACN